MKLAKTAVLILMVGIGGFAEKSILAQQPFSIVISGPATSVTTGSDVLIQIVLKNTSTSDVRLTQWVGNTQGELNYSIKVTDENGRPASETKYGTQARNKEIIGSRSALMLPSGEVWKETAALNKIYVLNPGQEYTVQVQRQYPNGSGNFITSNSIKVSVSK
jgi:hypothetical protein